MFKIAVLLIQVATGATQPVNTGERFETLEACKQYVAENIDQVQAGLDAKYGEGNVKIVAECVKDDD